jgi:hypothetical protein
LEKAVGDIKDLVLADPAPAPLVKAETYYRYHTRGSSTTAMTRIGL